MSEKTIAKVSHGALVVSFKNAKNPAIWRAQLDTLNTAVFNIETSGKSVYKLNLVTQEDKQEIARFSSKSAAEQALNAISDILFNLDDHTATAQPTAHAPATHHVPPTMAPSPAITPQAHRNRRVGYWMAFAVLFLFAVFFLMQAGENAASLANGMDTSGNVTANGLPDRPNADTMGGSVDDMPDAMEGRPLNADDFFNNRSE